MGMTQEMYDYFMKHSNNGKPVDGEVLRTETFTVEELIKRAKTDQEFEKLMSIFTLENIINDKMTPFPTRVASYYLDKINKSVPGDMVVFKSIEERVALLKMFFKENYAAHGAPIDLLKEGTIPLTDVRLSLPKGDCSSDFRFVIFPDYKEKLKGNDEKYSIVGGYTIHPKMASKKVDIIGLLAIAPGMDFIIDAGMHGRTDLTPIPKTATCSYSEWSQQMFDILMTWYSIQLTLLNPPTKLIYDKVRETTREAIKVHYDTPRKKAKVCYIKKIHLNPQVNFGSEDSDKYKKNCPYWRVIGHWREYKKSGKRIFIQGYWKGKFRNLAVKNSEELMRERVLAKPEGGEIDE